MADFLLELLCVTGDVPLLDYVNLIFYRTEVSAHGLIICGKQLREKIGPIFYRSKSQRTPTDFHSVCAEHNQTKITKDTLDIIVDICVSTAQ